MILLDYSLRRGRDNEKIAISDTNHNVSTYAVWL